MDRRCWSRVRWTTGKTLSWRPPPSFPSFTHPSIAFSAPSSTLQGRVQPETGSAEQPVAGRGAASAAEAGHHRQSDSPVATLQRDGGEAAPVAAWNLPPSRGLAGRGHRASAASPLHAGRSAGTCRERPPPPNLFGGSGCCWTKQIFVCLFLIIIII